MKKVIIISLLVISIFLGSSASANSNLDTVYNDGTVKEFTTQKELPNGMETKSFEGTGVSNERARYFKIPSNAKTRSQTKSIIGVDNRTIVTNTTSNPYKKIAFILSTFPNGMVYLGTGNFISSDMLLTAAHNIYSEDDGGYATSVEALPGFNGMIAPFGTANSKKLMVPRSWIDNKNAEHDLGAIKLDKNIGETVGWFGLTTNSSNPITLTGYHADLLGKMGTETGNYMRLTSNNIYYQLDTFSGASGSGIYNKEQQILGVHSSGATFENRGIRINDEKLTLIRSWLGDNVVPDDGLKSRINSILGRSHNTNISASDLNDSKLRYMNLEHAGIRSLEGLQYAWKTESLDLSYNSFANLAPLYGKNLQYLAVNHNNNLNDISAIKYAVNLGSFSCRFNPNLKNYNVVSNFTNLNRLDLGGAKMTSIEFMRSVNYPNLTYINFGQNLLTDITPLKQIKTLNYLNVDYNKISDFSVTKQLPKLETLVWHGNPGKPR